MYLKPLQVYKFASFLELTVAWFVNVVSGLNVDNFGPHKITVKYIIYDYIRLSKRDLFASDIFTSFWSF